MEGAFAFDFDAKPRGRLGNCRPVEASTAARLTPQHGLAPDAGLLYRRRPPTSAKRYRGPLAGLTDPGLSVNGTSRQNCVLHGGRRPSVGRRASQTSSTRSLLPAPRCRCHSSPEALRGCARDSHIQAHFKVEVPSHRVRLAR